MIGIARWWLEKSRNEMELLRCNSEIPDESERRKEAAPAFVEPVPRYEANVMH
jgi:hypothetical protein